MMKQASTSTPSITLRRIEIASPCVVSWGEMKGDDRVRHCGDCNKSVFNLSAMPQAEGAALLAGNVSGDLCVRFYQRADGTVMTSDCSASPRAYVRQTWRKLPGMASAAVLALSVAGCGSVGHAQEPPVMDAPPVITQIDVPEVQPDPPEPMVVMMGAPPPEQFRPVTETTAQEAPSIQPVKKNKRKKRTR